MWPPLPSSWAAAATKTPPAARSKGPSAAPSIEILAELRPAVLDLAAEPKSRAQNSSPVEFRPESVSLVPVGTRHDLCVFLVHVYLRTISRSRGVPQAPID